MATSTKRILPQMAAVSSRPHVFRLGGDAFVGMSPFTISASATYMTDIGTIEEARSLPHATNVATVGQREFPRQVRSAFKMPTSTFRGRECKLQTLARFPFHANEMFKLPMGCILFHLHAHNRISWSQYL